MRERPKIETDPVHSGFPVVNGGILMVTIRYYAILRNFHLNFIKKKLTCP